METQLLKEGKIDFHIKNMSQMSVRQGLYSAHTVAGVAQGENLVAAQLGPQVVEQRYPA